MKTAKSLCLNMIVKNETANLDRCLSAVADYIDCWVIGDTGSTDGTPDFVRAFFAARNIPGELHIFPFENFEQARNQALEHAYASTLQYDYLLFDDADMELVVEDREFRSKLTASSYLLLQRSSASYWNTRIVHRSSGARYRGLTHEYVEVAGDRERLEGVWYKDHDSGSNRVDKFERDIRLLEQGLASEPHNHRHWFYLAQSYRDAGQTEKAAQIYDKRAEMGGWDEEAWYARLQAARCRLRLGDELKFLHQALEAFNQRPHRAEPLYDLARFYREKAMYGASVLFAEAGLAIRRPDQDSMFVEDFVYNAGLAEEYSIAAHYSRNPARKDRGFAACNWLALSRWGPRDQRDKAHWNLFFYLKPASAMMPSFAARPIAFRPPDGLYACNPSIARLGPDIFVLLRVVNYTVTDGVYLTNGEPMRTRNFLLRLDEDLMIQTSVEVLAPENMPPPAFKEFGFEDARLFVWREELWCNACVREFDSSGLVRAGIGAYRGERPALPNGRLARPAS